VKRIFPFGVIACLLAAGHLYAPIFQIISPAELARDADVIVAGSAGSGVRSGNTVSFPLQVDRVLKGGATIASTTLSIAWTAAPSVDFGPPTAGYGIWFLRRPAADWTMLPAGYYAVPPGPILGIYAYADAASVTDKVAAELSSAIESANGGSFIEIQTNGGLDQLKSPVLQLLYQRMSTSDDLYQAMMGVSGLLRQGNGSALAAAIDLAPKIEADPRRFDALPLTIRAFFRPTDAASVAALGRAAADTTNLRAQLREACAEALAAIHTRQALPYLAALLDDADANVQSSGVRGLSAFTKSSPTPETFANRAVGWQDYLRVPFWKTWWAANHTALGY
jgi:hypothetical protein